MSSARMRLLGGTGAEAVAEPPLAPFLREKFPREAGAAGREGCCAGELT